MDYDLIIVGGGLAGSTLGKALAEQGARVVILERETAFRDRVRGEVMHLWGVAEARALGIYELFLTQCAREIRWWSTYAGSGRLSERRDLVETTPHQVGALAFYHPAMQEVLLQAASAAGAEVRRGTSVIDVHPGTSPTVVTGGNGPCDTLNGRLVVGADGRHSKVRNWGNFIRQYDPERLVIAGVLLEGGNAPEDTVHVLLNPRVAQVVFMIPIGAHRFRTYFIYRKHGKPRQLSGRHHLPDFLAACREAGGPASWFEAVEVRGPLAAFEGAASWVKHPYQEGLALVGDAAAASDPSWGCGLSLTLRDVQTLRDQLLADDDWTRAGHAYAEAQARYYGALHRLEGWMTDIFLELGPDAEARRTRSFPRFAKEPDRIPDLVGLGPDAPSDALARRRFFAED